MQNINNSPNSGIGGLQPSIIKSPLDDPLIDKAIGYPEDVSFEQQQQNQLAYEQNPKEKLQVNSYVYVDFPRKPLTKSFFSKRYQLFKIALVDAGKSIVLYRIKDLMDEWQKGYFYKEQLTATEPPNDEDFFKVDKVIRQKKVRGKTQYLVSYLHYPSKFNSWVKEEDLIEGK